MVFGVNSVLWIGGAGSVAFFYGWVRRGVGFAFFYDWIGGAGVSPFFITIHKVVMFVAG